MGLRVYGVVGAFLWALFGVPLLVAPLMTASGSINPTLDLRSIIVLEAMALAVLLVIGIIVGWLVALCLYCGGLLVREGNDYGQLVGFGGPLVVCLIAGFVQSFVIIPPHAGLLVRIACGLIPAFFFPRSLIRVAAPWRRRALGIDR